MDKFNKISGTIGKNDYYVHPLRTHDVDARELDDIDIQDLESINYKKRYGWVDINGKWLNSVFISIDEAQSKGYKWEVNEMSKILSLVDKYDWIDDAVGTFKEISILMSYDRFCRLGMQKKTLSKETFITYRDILEFVDKFYSDNLTHDELKLVMETNDLFGYSDEARKAYDNNTPLQRCEVMGDRENFEGFKYIDENTWELRLGS